MRISSPRKNSVPERMIVVSRSLKWNLTTALMAILTTMMFIITTHAAAEKSSMSTTAASTISTPTMPSIPQQEEITTPQVGSSSSISGSNVVGDDEIPKHRIGEMESSIGFYQAIELVQNSLLYSKQSKYQTYVFQSFFFYFSIFRAEDCLVFFYHPVKNDDHANVFHLFSLTHCAFV